MFRRTIRQTFRSFRRLIGAFRTGRSDGWPRPVERHLNGGRSNKSEPFFSEWFPIRQLLLLLLLLLPLMFLTEPTCADAGCPNGAPLELLVVAAGGGGGRRSARRR